MQRKQEREVLKATAAAAALLSSSIASHLNQLAPDAIISLRQSLSNFLRTTINDGDSTLLPVLAAFFSAPLNLSLTHPPSFLPLTPMILEALLLAMAFPQGGDPAALHGESVGSGGATQAGTHDGF